MSNFTIFSAEEYKAHAEIDDGREFIKTGGTASEEVWQDILLKYPHLARHVVFNSSVSVKILELAIDIGDKWTRFDVETKRRISREIFDKLAADPDPAIRGRHALNPKVPKDILNKLSIDEDTMFSRMAQESNVKNSDI